jgi:hypothetical protein
MRAMSRPLRTGLTLAILVAAPALGGCATVYHPRPSSRIVLVPEGGGVVLEKNGQIYSSSAFSSGIEEAVQGNAKAEEEASSYRSLSIGGFVLGILGAGTAGAGAGILAYEVASTNGNSVSGGAVAASVSLFVGGIVMGIIGNALQSNAHAHLYNAINIYNDGISGGELVPAQPGWAPRGYTPVVPGYAPPPPPSYPAPPAGYAPPPPPAAPPSPVSPGAPPALPAPAPLPH